MRAQICRKFILSLSAIVLAVGLSGCNIVGIAGVIAAEAERNGTTIYDAEYTGLEGHTFAVITTVDRFTEAEHPGVELRVADRINRDLYVASGGTGYIPGAAITRFKAQRPNWIAMPRSELAEELGVTRLIIVEINDYRLHDETNPYLWQGVAAAVVQVFEVDSGLPDDPLFEKSIRVTYPEDGVLISTLPEAVVTSELSRRLAQRISWLFFEHKEANSLEW